MTDHWIEPPSEGAAWFTIEWPGQPELGPYLLPDGRDIFQLIAEGRIDELGFEPTVVQTRSGPLGDMLWTLGSSCKVASERMLKTLARIKATGYRTFPLSVRASGGKILGHYSGIAVGSADPSLDLRRHVAESEFWGFLASTRVVDALREDGVTDLVIKNP